MSDAAGAADFASRAMLDVLLIGLRAQGVDLGAPEAGPARVPRSDKTALLAAAVSRHGPGVLLRVDAGLAAFEGRPLFEALTGGKGPWDVLERWGRLERYVHGRHRTRRTPEAPRLPGRQACRVQHHALGDGAPNPVESLAVLSVLAGLLRRGGAHQLDVRMDAFDLYAASSRQLGALIERGEPLTWVYEWEEASPRAPRSIAATDAFAAETAIVRTVAQLLANDLMRRWRLEDVANTLGMGQRLLQRDLTASGWRFTAVLARVRQTEAARRLREESTPLAEIGFLCGYSDQAHFSRQFERDVGLPPGQYRAAFRQAAGSQSPARTSPA